MAAQSMRRGTSGCWSKDLISEPKMSPPPARGRVVEWLNSYPVPRQEEPFANFVPNSEGEHPS